MRLLGPAQGCLAPLILKLLAALPLGSMCLLGPAQDCFAPLIAKLLALLFT